MLTCVCVCKCAYAQINAPNRVLGMSVVQGLAGFLSNLFNSLVFEYLFVSCISEGAYSK